MTRLDDALQTRPPLSPDALARIQAAAHGELSRRARSWRKDAARLVAVTFGLTAAAALSTELAGAWISSVLSMRWATLVLLVVTQLFAAYVAIAPGRRLARVGAVLAAAAAMVALVALRGAGLPSSAPQWTCTVSHLGLDLLPAIAAVFLLRHLAPNPVRALVAGLSAGATGAVLGELACGRGSLHVLLFHVPAWIAVSLLTLVVSRRLRPLSYAP